MPLSISVGVYDWGAFAPGDEFYPDDLPQDWRLSYYSNEFNSACIDLSRTAATLDELIEWSEDLPDSFELSFAVANQQQLEIVQGWLDTEDARLHALVIQDGTGNNLLQHRDVAPVLSGARQAQAPLCITHSAIWQSQSAGLALPFALLSADTDMRSWRGQIECWVNQLGDTTSAASASLWLPGADAGYRQLAELRQMVELMGY